MNPLLFENYGLSISQNTSSQFTFQGWEFHFVEASLNEQGLLSLAQIMKDINQWMRGQSSQLIAKKGGQFAVRDDDKTFVLWAIPQNTLSWNDLFQIHQKGSLFAKQKSYPISDLISLWEQKIDFIESKCLLSIRIDEPLSKELLVLSYWALGCAENALQYIADLRLDEGQTVSRVSLTHRRLQTLSSSHLLDPFNWVFDSPVRDLALIYTNGLMSLGDFSRWLETYQLSRLEANLLMARILYPWKVFDLLEVHYMDRIDIRTETHGEFIAIPKVMHRLINLHLFLVHRYQIRPIPWLFNYYQH